MHRKLIVLFIVILSVAAIGATAEQYFHVAAHNPGVNDTMWLTDAQIYNPDAVDTIEVRMAFLARGQANTDPDEFAVSIEPRQAVLLSDLVSSVLGRAQSGSIRMSSDHPFYAASRTYNIGDGESGTFGQYVAATSTEDALEQGLLQLASNNPSQDGFRTNVGFVNPNAEAVSIDIAVYDADSGVLLGTSSLDLEPFGFFQINNVFDEVGHEGSLQPNAVVEFLATEAVLAYGSIVDNTSGDAIFVTPREDSGTPPLDNNPPVATIDQPSGNVAIGPGDTVFFSGSASDPDGDDVTVLWDFGDGMTSTELEPGDHTFGDAGQYTVTLTATDSQGLSDPTPATRSVAVGAADNTAPDGTIDQPSTDVTIAPGETVVFAGSTSDPDGDDVTVLWVFDDGTTSTMLAPGAHVYSSAGVYSVTFTATDDQGLADPTPATRTITVEGANAPPNGTIDQPSTDVTIAPGETVVFAGSTSDPDGDDVTVLWVFDDGTTSTMLAPGAHVYSSAGVYSVTFTATDDQGLADPTPATRTITVEAAPNSPPDATIDQPSTDVTIAPGETVVFAGSTSDPDGDDVTVLWVFDDGTTSTMLAPGAHVYSGAGVYSVTFTATDDQGLADPTPATRTITVEAAPNSPPDATIDQPTGNVTITEGESVFFSGSASDPDGDTVSVLWDFGDAMSSTNLNPGNHTYSSQGTYTVTLTATDSQGLADPTPATRTITVNAAPSATLTQIQNDIFSPACSGCHGGGSPEAGLNLDPGQAYGNLVNVPASTQSGTRVIPSNPDNSVLVTFLEDGHRSRPQSEIDLIRDWITSGAPNN